MAVLPSITVTAGPIQAEFSADGVAVTGSAQMALALTLNGTVGRGAGELGTLSVGGLVGTGFVGGMTASFDAKSKNLEGVTYSIGIGFALPVAKSMELSDAGAKLLSGAGTVGVGLGEGRMKAKKQ